MKVKKTIIIGSNVNNSSISKQFLTLASELSKAGHKIIFLSQSRLRTNIYCKNEDVIYLEWPSLRPTKLKDFIFFFRLVKKHKPSLVISNFGAMNVMILVSWIRGVTYRITWYHTILASQKKPKNIFQRLIQYVIIVRKKFIYRMTTHIVPVSHAALEDVAEHFQVDKTKCKVFHNAIIQPEFTFNGTSKKITCLGRLLLNKGQDIFIKAAEEVLTKESDFTFQIVGSGEMHQYYKDLIRKSNSPQKIVIKPEVNLDEVPQVLGNSYISVVPSRQEAFGLVVAESMSVGTPVIASNIGGIPEIIDDGENGFLFEVEDYKQMAEKILLLIKNPQLRENFSQKARQKFLNQFEINNNIKKQVFWINNLLNDI